MQLILSTLGTLKLQPFQNGTHRFLLFLSVICAFLLVSLSLILFLAALGLHCFAWAFSSWQGVEATLRCGVRASHCCGFSCCGEQAPGAQASGVAARGLSSCARGLVALLQMKSSQARDQTRVPYIGGKIVTHCTPREVPEWPVFKWQGKKKASCLLLSLDSWVHNEK